ncbi:MAG: hypothetical protein ACR2IV_05220 [Bryobacteraceae bacterium]
MPKVLRALFVTTYFPLLWNPAFGQSQGVGVSGVQKPNNRTSGKTADTQADERGTYNRPFVVDTEGRKKNDQEATEAKADKDRTDYVQRWTLYYAGTAAVGTIGLVIVGAFAALFANRTLRAIERQGDFLREQVILMQAPHRQWIQLQNWHARCEPDRNRLLVRVDLLNPTDFPVTVSGSITFKGNFPTKYELSERMFLPPNTPGAIDVIVDINDEQIALFNQDILDIKVKGVFSHRATVYNQTLTYQEFSGWLRCGKAKGASFRYSTHLTPEYQRDRE